MNVSLPTDAAARKDAPLASGLLWYFPAALAAVARVSKVGNDQHNPNQPLHHARGKSMDHADCLLRHLADAGAMDTDGQRHTAKVAWRALALLQEEIEQSEGLPLPRGARPAAAPIDIEHPNTPAAARVAQQTEVAESGSELNNANGPIAE